MNKPLSELVVLELSGEFATRYCGKFFAEQGARVLQAYQPDDRHIGYGGQSSLALASWLDSGKQRVDETDVKPDLVIAGQYPDDIATAQSFVERCRKPPVLLGLTWFGQTGPYARWRGSDSIIQAMTGVAHAFGPVQGPPVVPQGHAPQTVAGATGFIAAMACLLARTTGGNERSVDVNVFESHMCLSEHSGPGFEASGVASARRGVNRFFPVYPQTIFRASDGWIGITALTPQQWQGLCELIGLPDLARDPAYATTDQRMAQAQTLDGILGPALEKLPTAQLLLEGQKRRVPIAPVPDMAQVLQTPHWRERDSFHDYSMISSEGGSHRFEGPAMPFRLHRQVSTQPAQALRSEPVAQIERKNDAGPLSGFRVLDLSMGWSGPLTGRHFADLGAQVIKVEACAHLDWWRGWNALEAGDPPPHETKSNFNAVNRNKLGITLDLSSARGVAVLRDLAATCHLLIENYAPGVLNRLGLSAAALSDVNPKLVYISMGAFGSAGPWSNFRAYGSTTEQASGMCFLNGESDWPPSMQHTAYGDPIAGIYAAVASLSALWGQHAQGSSAVGTTIDLSQVECLFQLAAAGLVAQSATGTAPSRNGSHRPTSAWSGCVRCAGPDDWIAIDIEDAALLTQRLQTAGIAHESSDQTPAAAIARWAAERDSGSACRLLQQADITAGPVTPASALLEDPHLKATGFWLRADRRHVGSHWLPRAPYAINTMAPPLKWPAPTLGEHNQVVLASVLGMSNSEIEALQDQGIIGTVPTV